MDTYQTILGEEPSEPVENLRLTRAVIEGWLANDVIEKQQRGELLATLYPRPKRDRFLVTCWLGLVAVFFLSGISAMVAANWDHFSGRERMSGVAMLYIVLIAGIIWKTTDTLTGKLLASCAGFTFGMLLVIVTQEYQLNVDGIWFYATWTCGVLPLAFVAKFLPLWVGWSVLLRGVLLSFFSYLDIDWISREMAGECSSWSFAAAALATLCIRHAVLLKSGEKAAWLKPEWPRFLLYLELHAVVVGFIAIYFAEFWDVISDGRFIREMYWYRSVLLPGCVALLIGIHVHFRRGGMRQIWYLALSVLAISVSAIIVVCIMMFQGGLPSELLVFLAAVFAFVVFIFAVVYVRSMRTKEVTDEVIYE